MTLLQYQRPIGVATILSGFLALACMIATMIAVDFNFDALSNPLIILSLPGTNIRAARASMIFDLFGYYLLLLPAIYLMHDWLKQQSPWASLISICGVAYVLIGAIGAAILAVVWPGIMAAYPAASPADQKILAANFSLVNDIVYAGMWNLLEMIFAATWWLFVGFQLIKRNYHFTGWLTTLTGISCLGDGFAGIIQSATMHEVFLNAYVSISILWAIAIGIFFVRKQLK